jgi:hypothetical protein
MADWPSDRPMADPSKYAKVDGLPKLTGKDTGEQAKDEAKGKEEKPR